LFPAVSVVGWASAARGWSDLNGGGEASGDIVLKGVAIDGEGDAGAEGEGGGVVVQGAGGDRECVGDGDAGVFVERADEGDGGDGFDRQLARDPLPSFGDSVYVIVRQEVIEPFG